jgi:hypothetical protein
MVISITLQGQAGSSAAASNPPPAAPPPAAPVDTPPEPAAPSEPVVNFDYFHAQLAPWGTWMQVGGVMYWRPDNAIAANPDWRPYYDNGKWVQTDNGLFWQSDYGWGDIPFHYGRWVRDPAQGWLWAPDYTWGPSWVFWRHAEADVSIGWAPLPPGSDFVDGALMFNGAAVALDYDFGLHEDSFTFVDYDHFHERYFRLRGREYLHHIDADRRREFYRRSVIRNEFRRDEHGRFVNNGIGRDRVEHLTKVEHSRFEERSPVGDRDKLATQRTETAGARSGASAKAAAPKAGAAKPGTAKAAAPVSKVFRPSAPKTAAPSKTPPKAPSNPPSKAPSQSPSNASSGKKK